MPIPPKRQSVLDLKTHAVDFKLITRGIEKESLRISPEGGLSQNPHPQRLGSALTHPHITTDFSEALLEFISSPNTSINNTLQQLDQIHQFTYQNINDELLWVNSMPCVLSDDDAIPVAQYGSSNTAKMKTIYRLGLGHRYGRAMQTIAGIHFNFSLPDSLWKLLQTLDNNQDSLADFRTQSYLQLIRNFRRYFWLLLYLFGASPAVCPTFVQGRQHALIPFGQGGKTLHSPYATSLRMGNLGYQSSAQQSITVNYNSLPDYLSALCRAITQPHKDYESVGLKNGNGLYQQLNTGILQIENEFYSTVRPKRSAERGETALRALFDRGVEYVEVRCVDLNPFEPLGINQEQIHFLDIFLLYCALTESPLADANENQRVAENQQRMVYQGRDPHLKLINREGEKPFKDWALSLMDELEAVATTLDQANNCNDYQLALGRQREKILDAELTPSAQVLRTLSDKGISFYQFGMDQAQAHKAYFQGRDLSPEDNNRFKTLAEESIQEQNTIEKEDSVEFETYLSNFYQQYQCCSPCEE